jgi:hypothetical protein
MSRVPEDDVHTTVRQRLRAARRAEGRQLYEAALQKVQTTSQAKQRSLNHCGQVLDNRETAISRLMHGDFYANKGNPVGELNGPKGPRTSHGESVVKDAATSTETAPCGRPHRDGRPVHHCHHGHRNRDVAVETVPQIPLWEIHNEAVKRSTSPGFAQPTTSSARKIYQRPVVLPNSVEMNTTAQQTFSARGGRSKRPIDPYEEVLHEVSKKHPPGETAVISREELERYRKVAEVPRQRPITAPGNRVRAVKPKDSEQIFY